MLERSLFANFRLRVDKVGAQRRLVLGAEDHPLPFMVWSAGQREFVPLLLGLYWLMPPAKVARRGTIEWVVLEELEMGLHPRAISVLLLMVLELVGARVSGLPFDALSPGARNCRALRHLKENRASPRDLLGIFEASDTTPMRKLAENVMAKNVKVYYFDPAEGRTKDISGLEPESEEAGEGGWGGLTEFSGRANVAVARAVADADRKAPPDFPGSRRANP